MKNRLLLLSKLSLIFFLFLVIFSSCVPIKRIEYLQSEVKKTDTLKTTFINKDITDYKIQPGDNLYIRINSTLSGADNFFNQERGDNRSSNYYNDAGIYLNSYMISDSGYVDFPFVGNIYVKDLTVEQAKNLIQSIVDDYIKETTVIVKLAIYNVTILGEVKRPGEYKIYQNQLTIFEALSIAGDLTTFAKRDKVALVRKTKNGSELKYLNLNKVDILESEYYYILPNDIIYIPPVKGKNYAFSNFPYALVLSVISTTILLVTFIQ